MKIELAKVSNFFVFYEKKNAFFLLYSLLLDHLVAYVVVRSSDSRE